ncbi:MAG: DUF302 domain-containing protein [Methylobacteriaceae bacterium]|nr:DUF302 domain-containing protein [Methylobacteriaceae bacterium]
MFIAARSRARDGARFLVMCATLALAGLGWTPARSESGLVRLPCACSYEALVQRTHAAITANGMNLVAEASPTGTAAAQGFVIPGDTVAMVFRNDFARRIIAVAPESMIEPPIRMHLRALPDGTSVLEYVPPSTIFARYPQAALQPIAAELDPIFAKIAADATRP